MTRGRMITLGVLILAVVAVGYYASTYSPGGGLKGACAETYNQLASANGNTTMEESEFLAYGQGATKEEFAKIDSDKDQILTSGEFCSWESQKAKG